MESEKNGSRNGEEVHSLERKLDFQAYAELKEATIKLEFERVKGELRSQIESETKQQGQAIKDQNWRHVKAVFWVLCAIGVLNVSGVVAAGLYIGKVTQKALNQEIATMRGTIAKRISEEFEEPRIKATVQDVASEHAARMLAEQIKPEVEKTKGELREQVSSAKWEMSNSLADFKSFISTSEEQHRMDYSTMAAQVKLLDEKTKQAETLIASLQERSTFYDLGDRATAGASGEAYDQLVKIANSPNEDDPKMRELARTEISKSKAFWIPISSLGGVKLSDFNWNNKSIDPATLTPCDLIVLSVKKEFWQVRLLSVRALGGRKYRGVSEALLARLSDPHLEVRKEAVSSWKNLTGYHSPDVFGVPHIPNWWKENQKDFTEKLEEPDCKESGLN